MVRLRQRAFWTWSTNWYSKKNLATCKEQTQFRKGRVFSGHKAMGEVQK